MFLPLYSLGPPIAPIRKRETIASCFGKVSASKKWPSTGSARSLRFFFVGRCVSKVPKGQRLSPFSKDGEFRPSLWKGRREKGKEKKEEVGVLPRSERSRIVRRRERVISSLSPSRFSTLPVEQIRGHELDCVPSESVVERRGSRGLSSIGGGRSGQLGDGAEGQLRDMDKGSDDDDDAAALQIEIALAAAMDERGEERIGDARLPAQLREDATGRPAAAATRGMIARDEDKVGRARG